MTPASQIAIFFDLDDTLYKEIDFVHSAYREIAASIPGIDADAAYRLLVSHPVGTPEPFDALYAWLQTQGATPEYNQAWMVSTYRAHKPRKLRLRSEWRRVLKRLRDLGHPLILVTDGRSETQRAKMAALGLETYFRPECIYISGEHENRDKLSGYPFEYFNDKLSEKCYGLMVGDNPAKDFYFAKNKCGFLTLQYAFEQHRNIHPSDPQSVAPDYRADDVIYSADELIRAVDIFKIITDINPDDLPPVPEDYPINL